MQDFFVRFIDRRKAHSRERTASWMAKPRRCSLACPRAFGQLCAAAAAAHVVAARAGEARSTHQPGVASLPLPVIPRLLPPPPASYPSPSSPHPPYPPSPSPPPSLTPPTPPPSTSQLICRMLLRRSGQTHQRVEVRAISLTGISDTISESGTISDTAQYPYILILYPISCMIIL
jgi:hypothetical protein